MSFFRKESLDQRLQTVERLIDHWAQLPHDPARAAGLLGGDVAVADARKKLAQNEKDIAEHTALIEELRKALARALRERDEVGIQLAAAQAEIARLTARKSVLREGLKDALDHIVDGPVCDRLWPALKEDTVPGDALADDKAITERFPTSYGTPPSPAGASTPASGNTQEQEHGVVCRGTFR